MIARGSAGGRGRESAGRDVAAVLIGSWRAVPPPPPHSLDLASTAPLLLRSGAGALAWHRLKGSPLAAAAAAAELHQAHRLHATQALLHDREVTTALAPFHAAGIEPLLGKGWAAAQLYPQPGLRPYGDVDLYVDPKDGEPARALVSRAPVGPVDLHVGCRELDDRRWEDLWARSRVLLLGDIPIRVFGPEDHLRLLCLHLLRHGAWRPLWLCDVAAAVEDPGLDWDRLLWGDRNRMRWVACAVLLARELLGAEPAGLPAAVAAQPLPRWLVPTVLRQWGDDRFEPQGTRVSMASELRRPGGALRALLKRWPNGIEATVALGSAPGHAPRLPWQLAACAVRTGRFLMRAAR